MGRPIVCHGPRQRHYREPRGDGIRIFTAKTPDLGRAWVMPSDCGREANAAGNPRRKEGWFFVPRCSPDIKRGRELALANCPRHTQNYASVSRHNTHTVTLYGQASHLSANFLSCFLLSGSVGGQHCARECDGQKMMAEGGWWTIVIWLGWHRSVSRIGCTPHNYGPLCWEFVVGCAPLGRMHGRDDGES